jgi:UvrD-like helicase C-terminal domain
MDYFENESGLDPAEIAHPAVIIPVLTQHYAMLQRNLLYTGVTRGKRLVVLVGQKKAIAIAVRNVSVVGGDPSWQHGCAPAR